MLCPAPTPANVCRLAGDPPPLRSSCWFATVTRIYTRLALFAICFLLTTLGVGLYSGRALNRIAEMRHQLSQPGDSASTLEDRAELRRQLDAIPIDQTKQSASVHRLFGLAAAVIVMLVNSVAITYFVGTSRWCREVVDTYRLETSLVMRSARLKWRTFPLAVVGMLTIVVVAALGAYSDPMTGRPGTWDSLDWHLTGAMTGIAVIAGIFYIQWINIAANNVVISEIMEQVRRIRAERGLEV